MLIQLCALLAACTDTPGWTNQFNARCSNFVTDGHCTGNGFAPGHEWADGPAWGDAGRHCCACGKSDMPADGPSLSAEVAPAVASVTGAPCVDTRGWRNQFGGTCEKYASEGHCRDGAMVPGHEWADSPDFNVPSENCCVCGKGRIAPSPPPSPPPPPPPGAPSPPPPPPPAPMAPSPPLICEDVCPFIFNGVCQDGGPNAQGNGCEYGTDCGDCGPRAHAPPPPPRPSPPQPPPPPPPPRVRMSRPKPFPPSPPAEPHPPPMEMMRPPEQFGVGGGSVSYLTPPQQQQPQPAFASSGGGQQSTFRSYAAGERVDLGWTPPPPPPYPPGVVIAGLPTGGVAAESSTTGTAVAIAAAAAAVGASTTDDGKTCIGSTCIDKETKERVHALVDHGTAAAIAIGKQGAVLAKEAARSFQGASGVSAEQVEMIGLGIGLLAGIFCLCCLRCACAGSSSGRKDHDLSNRQLAARRALAGMTSSRNGGRARNGSGSRMNGHGGGSRYRTVGDYEDDFSDPEYDLDYDEEDLDYNGRSYR